MYVWKVSSGGGGGPCCFVCRYRQKGPFGQKPCLNLGVHAAHDQRQCQRQMEGVKNRVQLGDTRGATRHSLRQEPFKITKRLNNTLLHRTCKR